MGSLPWEESDFPRNFVCLTFLEFIKEKEKQILPLIILNNTRASEEMLAQVHHFRPEEELKQFPPPTRHTLKWHHQDPGLSWPWGTGPLMESRLITQARAGYPRCLYGREEDNE